MNYSQVTVDILQNDRYEGAIDSIKWLTDWVDVGFGTAITVVAFLIISVAMLKNVLAGAYCAYPRFWDMVDAAHQEVASVSWVQQVRDTVNIRTMNTGSFKSAVLRLLPNIKCATDFEGDTVRPKAYFIRALPQMFLCIIIGAFIYNGYYRDAASKVVDFGSEMVSRVLLEVDPVAVFDQITGVVGRPVFASDDSQIPSQQLVNKLSTDSYSAIIGEYHDVSSAEAKRYLADIIEGKMNDWVTEIESVDPEFVDGEHWQAITQVTLTTGAVSIDKLDGVYADATLTYYQEALTFPVSDLNLVTNINVGVEKYVRILIGFEKQVVMSGTNVVSDIALTVPFSNAGDSLVISTPTGTVLELQSTAGSVSFTIDGATGGKLVMDSVLDEMTIYWESEVTRSTGSVLKLATDLVLMDSNTNERHRITSIVLGSGFTISSVTGDVDGVDFDYENLGVVVS